MPGVLTTYGSRGLSSVLFGSSIFRLLAVVALDASIVTGFTTRSLSSSSSLPPTFTGVKTQPTFHHQYQQQRPHHRRPFFGTTAMKQSSSSTTSTSAGSSSSMLSPRVLETLDPCVVLMKDMIGQYAHLWDDKDKGGIFSLAQGVVYWEPPNTCQEALVEEFSKPNNLLHTYSPAQGIPELTSVLQEKIATENGLTDHSVMVTVGANQAYVNIVLTCLCDTSKAIVFAPFYFNHVMALQMCCGNDSVVVGPCTTEDGIPDVTWLEDTLTKQSIDMVTIVNPGNPTGVSLDKEVLQNVVDLCEKHNTWLVLDCTYEYFTRPDGHQPLATFPDAPHVIHIFSLSKSYSLAGYRCGYVCLPNKSSRMTTRGDDDSNNSNLLSNMLKVQDTLPIGPPRVSQIAALGALKAGPAWVREKYATLDASRDLILESLKPLKVMGGSGAMYVMAQLPPPPPTNNNNNNDDGKVRDDVEICRQLVEEFGIAIIPGTYCGFPGWIRVCYANLPPDQCRKAADRLRDGLQSILF